MSRRDYEIKPEIVWRAALHWQVLDPILCLRRLGCLPLHVARGIGSATLQGNDMIDHVA
jgi:hypothetical protein